MTYLLMATIEGLYLLSPLCIIGSSGYRDMRILLYNIRYATGHKNGYHLPLPYSGFFRRTTANMEQIVDFIELLDPFLVGLIEVDAGSYRSSNICQAEIIADRLGYYPLVETKYGLNSLAAKMPVLGLQSNALLSKEPADDVLFHYFSKGMKRMVIHSYMGSLSIFLVHLALTYRHRQTQLEELYSLIQTHRREHLIVAGDFNTLWGSKELNLFMAATGLRNADKDGLPSHPSHAPTRQLDFILHSNNIIISDFFIPKVQLSDHMPLVCDFALN